MGEDLWAIHKSTKIRKTMTLNHIFYEKEQEYHWSFIVRKFVCGPLRVVKYQIIDIVSRVEVDRKFTFHDKGLRESQVSLDVNSHKTGGGVIPQQVFKTSILSSLLLSSEIIQFIFVISIYIILLKAIFKIPVFPIIMVHKDMRF